jgi:hypothetical protein
VNRRVVIAGLLSGLALVASAPSTAVAGTGDADLTVHGPRSFSLGGHCHMVNFKVRVTSHKADHASISYRGQYKSKGHWVTGNLSAGTKTITTNHWVTVRGGIFTCEKGAHRIKVKARAYRADNTQTTLGRDSATVFYRVR